MSNNESKEVNSAFQIREVERKDMGQICDIHARCWKKNFKWIIAQDHLDNFGRNPDVWWQSINEKDSSSYSMFVYDKWWKVVGFIDGWPWEIEWFDFEVYGFYVDPDAQRLWVWMKLWEYLIDSENFKDKRSFYLRTLKDNTVWCSFYKKMWWEIIEEKKKKLREKEYDLVCYARRR